MRALGYLEFWVYSAIRKMLEQESKDVPQCVDAMSMLEQESKDVPQHLNAGRLKGSHLNEQPAKVVLSLSAFSMSTSPYNCGAGFLWTESLMCLC